MDYFKKTVFPFMASVVTAALVLFLFMKFDVNLQDIKRVNVEKEKEVFEIGVPIEIGDFKYNIMDIEKTKVLHLKNDTIKIAKEDEEFVVVSIFIESGDKKSKSLSRGVFALYDDKNRKYKILEDAELKREGFFEPYRFYSTGQTLSAYLVFSIPEGEKMNALLIGVNSEYQLKNDDFIDMITGKRGKDPKGPKFLSVGEEK